MENEVVGIKKATETSMETYYFRKNLQGDVIAILDSSGIPVVKYAYNAWGNHKAYSLSGDSYVLAYDSETGTVTAGYENDIAVINPIRYRSYHFDGQTVLYYLQTRYYDPQVGRFISPDSVDYLDSDSINGLNLYVYCGNNPVMYTDPSGHDWEWSSFWKGVGYLVTGIGALSNAGASALENKSWANIGASAVVDSIAAGVGFGLGRVVSNYVFKNSGMTFMDFFEIGKIDTNAIFSAVQALVASWYVFLPSLTTSASRGTIKALGNLGIGWF